MQALFEGGRVVDLILVLMALEGIALGILHRRTGRGIPPSRLWPNLIAGACLMLALRAALTDSSSGAVAAWLVLGLAGHLADVAMRWQRNSHRG